MVSWYCDVTWSPMVTDMLPPYLCIQLLPLLIHCQHVAEMLFAPDQHLLNLKGAQPNCLQQKGARNPSDVALNGDQSDSLQRVGARHP